MLPVHRCGQPEISFIILYYHGQRKAAAQEISCMACGRRGILTKKGGLPMNPFEVKTRPADSLYMDWPKLYPKAYDKN